MDMRYKPTIIKLGKNSHESGKEFSEVSRNICEFQGDNFTTHISTESEDKKVSLLRMTSVTDVELLNDFKWLINFSLKSMSLYDIDGEFHEKNKINKQARNFRSKENNIGKRSKRNTLKDGCLKDTSKQRKKNVSKSGNPFLFSDIIEKCLSEKSGITLKTMYKWIRDRFPCFKQTDRKWKKFVHHSLTTNPLFKKKASKRGRSELWYLDKSNTGDQRNIKPSREQNSSITMNSAERRRLFQHDFNDDVNSAVYLPAKEYNALSAPLAADVQANTTEIYSGNWMETTGFPVKEYIDVKLEEQSKYYEMQIPLAAEYFVESEKYAESLEVTNILDGSSPISLELL